MVPGNFLSVEECFNQSILSATPSDRSMRHHLARVLSSGRPADAVKFLGVVDHGEPSCGDEMPPVRHVEAVRPRGVSHEGSPSLDGREGGRAGRVAVAVAVAVVCFRHLKARHLTL